MNKRRFLSILSLILVLVFILLQTSVLTACKKNNEGDSETSDDSSSNGNVEEEIPSPLGSAHYIDTVGKPIVKANYCADMTKATTPVLNHLTPESDSAPSANTGFLWNADQLAVVINSSSAASAKIEIGDLNESVEITSGSLFKTYDFTATGFTPKDIGQFIPVKITVTANGATSVFEGFTELCDYKICYTTDCTDLKDFTSVSTGIAGSGTKVDPSVAGVEIKDNALRIYDTYANGAGKALTQSNLFVSGVSSLSSVKPLTIEGDITIDSMPVYAPQFVAPNSTYGLYFNVTRKASANSILFSIINTEEGLALVSIGESNDYFDSVLLGKALGDTFHLSVLWDTDDSLTVSVDGFDIKTIKNAGAVRGSFKENSINIVCQRNTLAPKSDADDFDVTLSSLCVSYDQSKSLMETIDIRSLFGDDAVVQLDGDDIYLAPKAMTLKNELSVKKYGLTSDAVWVSSNPKVVSHEGVLTPPSTSGEFITYTVYLVDGEYIVSEKEFLFFAKGENPAKDVYFVKADNDPFNGKAQTSDTVFTLDKALNSIVYDMGSVTDVNRATVISTKNTGFINKNFVSLLYSNDNVTYELIKDFSILQSGNTIYFYNFNVEARYIKIHTTIGSADGTTGNLINSLQNMMTAEYSNAPLLSQGEFKYTTSATVENDSSETVYNKVVSFTLSDLGIDASSLKSDKSDIRFTHDGFCLPHYFDGTRFYVRVFELDADEEISVTVLYGNENAESINNGEETFEMQYGTKFASTSTGQPWQTTVAEMPNGDLLNIVYSGGLAYYRSTDGGLSWSALTPIPNATEVSIPGGGCIVDKEAGKVFYCGYYWEGSPTWICKYYVYESSDNGYTWSLVGTPQKAPQYAISYSDGIKLSCADGEGPNVDYVYTTGCMRDIKTQSFCTTAFYSKDGGKTWIFSDSYINYNTGAVGMEMGMSEEAVWEQEDGTLIFYARCQEKNIIHFAISRSTDHGVTWSDITSKDFSNVYTPNTQPIIEGLNGSPILLWGGNNSIGGSSYKRFPLNMATSDDDGETFKNIINASFQTLIDTMAPEDAIMLHTNPDIVFYNYMGVDCAYIVTTGHQMYVINVDDFIHKTKGAFDSFENGMLADGWQKVLGSAIVSSAGATDGEKALLINSNSTISRSLHYMEEGTISFDYTVLRDDIVHIELQTAFNNLKNVTAPIRIISDANGNLYSVVSASGNSTSLGIKLEEGANEISISFNGNEKNAEITVNGTTKPLGYIGNDAYISYITIFTGINAQVALDKFIAIREA